MNNILSMLMQNLMGGQNQTQSQEKKEHSQQNKSDYPDTYFSNQFKSSQQYSETFNNNANQVSPETNQNNAFMDSIKQFLPLLIGSQNLTSTNQEDSSGITQILSLFNKNKKTKSKDSTKTDSENKDETFYKQSSLDLTGYTEIKPAKN